MKKVYVVCYSHVDLVWERCSEEYVEEIGNIMLKVFDLLERYREFRYVITQALLFRQWVERNADKVDRLRRYIAEGRITVVGGMLALADANIPSPESMARNLLYGRRWFGEQLGVEEIRTAWYIDVFGYSAQLPQLLRLAGFDSMVVTRAPEHFPRDPRVKRTYRAVGIDGSSVLVSGEQSHFTRSYADVDTLEEKIRRHLDVDDHVFAFVYTEDEFVPFERTIECLGELARSGIAVVEYSDPADYFTAVERSGTELAARSADLNPIYSGTYTTRISLKLANRRFENELTCVEHFAALRLAPETYSAIHARIRDAWFDVIFNQFHDALCGCNNQAALRDIRRRNEQIGSALASLRSDTLGAYAPGDEVEIWNGLSAARVDVCDLELTAPTEVIDLSTGVRLPSRALGGGLRVLTPEVPAYGARRVRLAPAGAAHVSASRQTVTGQRAEIENDFYRVSLERSGVVRQIRCIASGTDLLSGYGNVLIAREETGNTYTQSFTGRSIDQSDGEVEEVERIEDDLGQSLVVRGTIKHAVWLADGEIPFTQEIHLYRGIDRIDFRTTIDWHGQDTLLQVAFPTVYRYGKAFFEIPFGAVERFPYYDNAHSREEWPAQRFALCQGDSGGVALINTGHPGHRITSGEIVMSLLRSPSRTRWGSDVTQFEHGVHVATYSLVAFSGDWSDAGIALRAQAVNQPLAVVGRGGPRAETGPSGMLEVTSANIVVTGIKQSEDDPQRLLVRLYESTGKATTARVTFDRRVVDARSCNIHETPTDELSHDDTTIEISLARFQILSILVTTDRA